MNNKNHNRTKIVATIGPATSSLEKLRELILAGVDVCRVNMSHGNKADHADVIRNVRQINSEIGAHACILLDLQGPKLRVGVVENDKMDLVTGESIVVTTLKTTCKPGLLFVNYPNLAVEAKVGESILIDDGKIELKVTGSIDSNNLKAEVIQGGILTSNKGFNLPHTNISMPALTPKDLEDLQFGLEHNVEWVGLSFVRKAEDIIYLKGLIGKSEKDTRVIAKIEKPEAILNIDTIIKVTDGVMVARGDLGVELPIQRVPLIQKDIIDKCILAGKPVIIATQMMESMIVNSTPTRAEVADVANAVLDGADAVMLSAETSIGAFPIKVVQLMNNIIVDVENDNRVYFKGQRPSMDSATFLSDEICFTSVRMSDHINAKAIVAMTKSGYTGFKVASYRPKADIYIFTDNRTLLQTLNLVWGVRGFYYDRFESTDQTFEDVIEILKSNELVVEGDRIINCASMPMSQKARTNALKISVVN